MILYLFGSDSTHNTRALFLNPSTRNIYPCPSAQNALLLLIYTVKLSPGPGSAAPSQIPTYSRATHNPTHKTVS